MKPRRTHYSTNVFRLEGGTEDNDLWVEMNPEQQTIRSVWELTDEERKLVAEGHNVYLVCWGTQVPVALGVTDDRLGAPHGKRS